MCAWLSTLEALCTSFCFKYIIGHDDVYSLQHTKDKLRAMEKNEDIHLESCCSCIMNGPLYYMMKYIYIYMRHESMLSCFTGKSSEESRRIPQDQLQHTITNHPIIPSRYQGSLSRIGTLKYLSNVC